MSPDEHWTLWRRDPRSTPFQSPAWLDAWWSHLGGGERVEVEARGAGGQLVGALPMFVWHDAGVRRLVPIGAGHSDYTDALVDPHAREEAVAGLWAAIAAASVRWDEVLLPDLRVDSPLLGTVPDGWVAVDSEAEVCPVTALPLALSKSRRRKIAHDRNRAEALGGVEAALVGPEALDEALDALFALHAARWEREGQAGVLAEPKVQAFHRAAAPALQAAGLLRVAVVRHEGRIVAVLLSFVDGARGMSYINGVDFNVPGQSFGTLAFACLIEAVQAEGKSEFHFLRGEEGYKYAWGAEPTRTWRRVVRPVS